MNKTEDDELGVEELDEDQVKQVQGVFLHRCNIVMISGFDIFSSPE